MAAGFSFDVGTNGKVSALVHRAADPIAIQATLILAPGAGANQRSPFMTTMAARIASRGVDVVTFDFLYAQAGKKLPDRPELLEACWRAAIASVRARGGLPTERLFIGGKSMGGRIATRIAGAAEGLVLTGVVLLGYPLHPIGKPRSLRTEILEVPVPLLVVQGTRDDLGTAEQLKKLLTPMSHARVKAIEGGDHSFAVPQRRSPEGIERQERAFDEAAAAVVDFIKAPRGRSRKTGKR